MRRSAWDKKIREGSEIQSIMFKKRYWSLGRSKHWLIDHKFDGLIPDVTDNYIRYRQEDPDKFDKKSYRTISLTKSIKAVVAIPLRSNRGSAPRKTIQFQKVLNVLESPEYSWEALPIQYSTASNVYFFCIIENGIVRIYSINQKWMPCEDLALEGELSLFLDIPRELKALPTTEQIAWWNNHISMIYFENKPVKDFPLFGRTERNRYYFSDGTLYLHSILEEYGEVVSDTHTPVTYTYGGMETPLFLLDETDAVQTATIGINRRYLQGMITRAMS